MENQIFRAESNSGTIKGINEFENDLLKFITIGLFVRDCIDKELSISVIGVLHLSYHGVFSQN